MTSQTPNRALRKAVDSDDAETYLTDDLGATLDNLDTHAHSASDITSGTVGTARLGTGSASSATFLRGDQTWAAPAGGGGGDLLAANNLSDVANAATARTNLGANNASNLSSGTVPTARLGSGTANSGSFLRGDQTWQVAPGASPDAVDVSFSPAGNIASTEVQSAITELDTEKAPITHTHGAGDINSGTIAAARLGTGGPPSTSTFLRGDSQWTGIDAGVISSGTMATARLGSGTASIANFLRGDRSWATLAATDISSGQFAAARLGSGTADATKWLKGNQTWAAFAASDIASGTIDTARLGSGTADATKVLFGDQTWDVIAAGDIASGLIATARLGGGAASSTTVLKGDQTWGSSAILSPDGTSAPQVYVGTAEPTSPANGTLWLDTFEHVVDWADGTWPARTLTPVTIVNPQPTLSYTTVQLSADVNAAAIAAGLSVEPSDDALPVGRITNTGSTVTDSQRYLMHYTGDPDLADSEMLSLIDGHLESQTGHFHRLVNIGNGTTQKAYAVWENVTGAAIRGQLLIGVWNGQVIDGVGTNSFPTLIGGVKLEGLGRTAKVRRVTKSGSVTTLYLDKQVPDGWREADLFQLDYTPVQAGVSTGSYKGVGNFDVPGRIQYLEAGSETVDANVTGYVFNHHPRPYWLNTKVVGNKIYVRAWNPGDPVPSWNDPRFSVVITDGGGSGPAAGTAGKTGHIVAHNGTAADRMTIGPLRITRPGGPGLKLRESGAWRRIGLDRL